MPAWGWVVRRRVRLRVRPVHWPRRLPAVLLIDWGAMRWHGWRLRWRCWASACCWPKPGCRRRAAAVAGGECAAVRLRLPVGAGGAPDPGLRPGTAGTQPAQCAVVHRHVHRHDAGGALGSLALAQWGWHGVAWLAVVCGQQPAAAFEVGVFGRACSPAPAEATATATATAGYRREAVGPVAGTP